MMLLLWLAATAGSADYVTPAQAGFHHCMLIYDAEARGAEGFAPYVAHLDPQGRPDQWFFDAFLLCAHQPGPSTKASYHFGATNRTDWEALQDGWFSEQRGPAALQEAVERAKEALGPRDRPVEVILTIPYPSAEQADFGDADGDGASEDLSRPEAREAAAKWYLDRALAKWAKLRAPDLHLWGFYWTNEGIGAKDAETVQRVARLVHERGYRFLWIPWFRAPGFRLWRDLGFDVAILQPNYAFLSDHLGKVRSDRLIETAALAESLGMGVEMEVGYSPDRDLREREIFREYLAFGAPSQCGYQEAATAYFQSLQVFANLPHAEDPDARRVYDEIAAYVRGEAVARPGGLEGARVTVEGDGATAAGEGAGAPGNGADVTAESPAPELVDGVFATPRKPDASTARLAAPTASLTVEFPRARAVGEVELSCVRSETPWSGIVSAEVRDATGAWRPGGWLATVVPAQDPDMGLKDVIAVPVFTEEAYAVRVQADADGAGDVLRLDEVTVTCGPPRLDWREPNLAYGRPYAVEPEFPRQYPDRGGMLTDGEVSTEGWTQGRSVGWLSDEATLRLDLGEVREVERVVVHCDGGGYAWVHFPTWLRVALATEEAPAPPVASGLGPPPPVARGAVEALAQDVQLDGQRAVADGTMAAWGHFELRLDRRPARFVTLHFRHTGWLMLSEVEAWSGGINVGRGARYQMTPSPAGGQEARYADDGRLLTDGCVAGGFQSKRIVGWSDAETMTVTVDLGAAREVREVMVHTLGGGQASIYAPPKAELELSEDGGTYRVAGEATLEDPGGDVCVPLAMRFGLPQAQPARFVRVRAQRSRGWTMLSEVVVR